jgi:hypothetical protein
LLGVLVRIGFDRLQQPCRRHQNQRSPRQCHRSKT